MGTVYRAYDPQLEREVAIKVLTTADAELRAELSEIHTVDLRARAGPSASSLLAEARIMARLSHPNVVPVYEVGLDGSDVFVVMELVAGEDLRHWLATPRTTPEILAVFAQAARGLGAAHASAIVHRDFKPDNVLIGADGRVRVADFGLSRITSTQSLVRIAELGGTPKYMAPELWNGALATPAADIYALCTALAEAFGVSIQQTAPDRALAFRTRGVPLEVSEVIEAGLSEDPAARPTIDRALATLLPRIPRSRVLPVAIGISVVAAIATGVVIAVATSDTAAPACTDDPTLLVGRWDTSERDALRAKLANVDGSDRVLAAIDARAAELVGARRAVCEAGARGAVTEAQATQRTSCLERRAIELGATADAFVRANRAAVPGTVEEWLLAITPTTCDELELPALGDRVAVEALYQRFAVVTIAEDRSKLTGELAAIEREAAALGDPELEIRAGILLGIQQRNADDIPTSIATLERAYRRALAIRSANQQAIVLGERSASAMRGGDARAAKSFAQLARELVDKDDIPVRTRVRIYRSLGRAELIQGRYDAAIELLKRGLAILDQSGERFAEMEILARMDLTDALLKVGGREDEGLAVALATVTRARSLLGPRVHQTALAINQVGKAYQHKHELEQSLTYRREALALIASELPPTSSDVLHQRAEVAQTLQHLRQVDAAREEFLQIIALAERNPGMLQYVTHWQTRLARALYDSGRHDEGLARLEAAIVQTISDQGAEHPVTLARQFTLADFQIDAGKLDAAAKTVATLERLYGKSTAPKAKLLLTRVRGELLARLLLARGRAREAEAITRLALASFGELGARPAETATTLLVRGNSLVELSQHAGARVVLEQALEFARSERAGEDIVALVELGLARADHGLGKRTGAIASAERIRDVLARYPGQPAGRRDVAAFLAKAHR
jgi:tetratricopeptide (TPR) repeat protein